METNIDMLRGKRFFFSGVLILMLLCGLYVQPALATENQTITTLIDNNTTYRVLFNTLKAKGTVNRQLTIPVTIDPSPAPVGKFYSILAATLEKPSGATIESVSGNNRITFTMDTKGLYRVKISVNLLEKTSCAGINANEIGSQVLTLQID